ncbi:MAG: DUF6094 domain-containing protein [Candidatus Sulfotelmatobacter sp.]
MAQSTLDSLKMEKSKTSVWPEKWTSGGVIEIDRSILKATLIRFAAWSCKFLRGFRQSISFGLLAVLVIAENTRCPAEAVSLLYLNPPYDWECGEINNQRLELVFLEHSYRWLKAGGVLIFIIPQLRLAKCARLLSEHFTDLRVFRLTEPACLQYKQIVALATRRKRDSKVSDAVLLGGVRHLEALATKSEVEALGDNPEVQYEVPASEQVILIHVGIPLDEVEDLLLEPEAPMAKVSCFRKRQLEII